MDACIKVNQSLETPLDHYKNHYPNEQIPLNLIKLLKKCFIFDLNSRPSAEELLNHSYFKQDNDEINSLDDHLLNFIFILQNMP